MNEAIDYKIWRLETRLGYLEDNIHELEREMKERDQIIDFLKLDLKRCEMRGWD